MAVRSGFFCLSVAVVATAVLVASAAHAEETGSVSGSVLLRATRAPVSGVSVRVLDNVGMYRAESTTDKSGRFSIVGLQPGRYTGLFEKTGFEYAMSGFDICPGAQTTMIALMRAPRSIVSGSVEQIRLANEQPKPAILSTSTMTVTFNQWAGLPPPRCM